MLSFKALSEKKTKVKINPKMADVMEGGAPITMHPYSKGGKVKKSVKENHGEDCDCMKCEEKRRKEDVNDGPDVANEESCGKGMYYCNTDKKCKPIPEGYKEDKDGMLVKEAKYEAGASNYGKMSIRNKRAVGYGGNAAPPEERKKAHDERMKKHKAMKEGVSAKERLSRDAGAIAKKKMRNKEHRKYVNFLDVDESNIHSFNTFIQNNKPYDSQKEVSEESDKESKVETSLLKFSECWKTHKKVGMKMKGGKLVNDCRPKTASDYKKEEVEIEEKVYTGPDKKDKAVIKKMDNPSYAKKLADYEKNMDPKKRQALKDKATKGMKFTHEAANPAQQAAIAIDMKKKGKKPKDIQEKDLALDMIRKKYKDQIMKRGQPKKVKGAKSTVGTGKYKKMADQKKQTAADAKKRGFKSTQDYVNTMARYGGKDNYDKGKGLGT